MLALAAMVTITAVIFGAVRFRVPADVADVVCGVIALDAAWARLHRRLARSVRALVADFAWQALVQH